MWPNNPVIPPMNVHTAPCMHARPACAHHSLGEVCNPSHQVTHHSLVGHHVVFHQRCMEGTQKQVRVCVLQRHDAGVRTGHRDGRLVHASFASVHNKYIPVSVAGVSCTDMQSMASTSLNTAPSLAALLWYAASCFAHVALMHCTSESMRWLCSTSSCMARARGAGQLQAGTATGGHAARSTW